MHFLSDSRSIDPMTHFPFPLIACTRSIRYRYFCCLPFSLYLSRQLAAVDPIPLSPSPTCGVNKGGYLCLKNKIIHAAIIPINERDIANIGSSPIIQLSPKSTNKKSYSFLKMWRYLIIERMNKGYWNTLLSGAHSLHSHDAICESLRSKTKQL